MLWRYDNRNCTHCLIFGDYIKVMVCENHQVWNCFVCNKGGNISKYANKLLKSGEFEKCTKE